MEAPKKRGRGRPRISDEERKASQARARAKYRERVDVDLDRRRIRLHVETFQQWRKLREKANVNSDDGFAKLLMKCFSDHAEEYRDKTLLASFQTPMPIAMGMGSLFKSEQHLKAQVKSPVHVKEEKPKRKRGRPPGRRTAVKAQKTTPEPPTYQYIPIIESIPSFPQSPRTIPASPPESLSIPDGDLSNLSPSVRSARLAFSRALAQSFNAMTSPNQTESVQRNLLHEPSSSGETIASVVPIDDVHYQQEDDFDPSLGPSTFEQTNVIGIAPRDDLQSRHESTFEPSQRLLVGESDIDGTVYQDSAEEGYYSQSSVQYSEVVYGDEKFQSLQDQSGPQASENTETFAETNGSSHLASEPDLSLPLDPESGLKEESIELIQPLGKSDAKVVKVPDPMRRSRLNQITGGLLNRLKLKAMTAEPTQD